MTAIDRVDSLSDRDGSWFEVVVIELSAHFINRPADQVDDIIEVAQKMLCHHFNIDRSTLWQRDPAHPDTLRLTHLFQPPGSPVPPSEMDAAAHFPWTLAQIRAGKSVVIASLDDLPSEAAHDRDVYRRFSTHSNVILPLCLGEQWLGALTFASVRRPRIWPVSLVRRLELVAHLFTHALARKTAFAAQRESDARYQAAAESARDLAGRLIRAQEDERARVARELHDDITQRLARLAIDVGRFAQHASLNSVEENLIRGVREGLATLSHDVHALSYELHPSTLLDLGLVDSLRAECESFSRRYSISAYLKTSDLPPAIPREVALGLFRIAQESLRNAIRHGRATSAELTLRAIDNGLQLAIRDDGCGFHPAQARTRPSLGLASMLERTRLLNGDLDIDSRPGEGTTIIAWIPLPENMP